jgi:hypothetical protein
MLLDMNAWVALAAGVVGAAIALVGQYVTRRSDRISSHIDVVVEQCAQFVALSEDFRNRFWEESQLRQAGRVDGWDIAAHRLAEARLKIVCDDEALLTAIEELSSTGKALGGYWRRGDTDQAELDLRYERYKEAIGRFVAEAKRYRRSR